jgi:hypothetical protein
MELHHRTTATNLTRLFLRVPLLEKRSALAADLAVAEDTVSQLRRQIMALSETPPCWRCSPSSPSGPMISLDATASIPGPLPGIPSNT